MTNYDLALKYLGPKDITGLVIHMDSPMGWSDKLVIGALKIAAGIPDEDGEKFIKEQL